MTTRAWRDLALAAVVAAVAVGGAVTAPPARTPIDGLAVALLIAAGLVLAIRRPYPRVVVVTAAAMLLAYLLLGYPGVGPALPVLVALHNVVSQGGRRIAGITIVTVLLVGAAGELLSTGGHPPDVVQRWFLLIGWMVAASAIAGMNRQHRAYLAEAQQRAAEAERTREEVARRRADEERLRIARELHDSLTHSISIIKVQAGVAVHLANKRGEPVPDALVAIQHASTDAMRELRNTLEVLRTEEPGAAEAGNDPDQPLPPAGTAGGATDRPHNGSSPANQTRHSTGTSNGISNGYGASNGIGTRKPSRNGPDGTGPDVAGRARPDPDGTGNGLGRLDQLVDGARRAGVPITVHVEGRRRDLPGEVDGAAYRIVQEALTNVARHAGPATAAVSICYGESALTVRVDDDGRGADAHVPGVGLTGMRERVAALGGRLQAGPRPAGGFSVQAELPLAVPA